MGKCEVKIKGIIRNEDKYLLVKRWYDDRIDDPYQWQFIDGDLEYGEEPDRAVLRLIKEQTGLDAMIQRVLYTWSYMLGDDHYIGISYECMVFENDIMLSEELNDYCYVSGGELKDYISNQSLLEDLERTYLI